MRTRTSSLSPKLWGVTSLAQAGWWWSPTTTIPPHPGEWAVGTSLPPTISANPALETSGGTSEITDDPSRSHRIKYVRHNKSEWSYTPTQEYYLETYVGDYLSASNSRYKVTGPFAIQRVLWGAYAWPGLAGVGNVAFSYAKDDAALLNDALHKLMDGNEVDNFTNIRESGQTVDMLSGLGDKWNSALLWMPSRNRLSKRGRMIPDWSRAVKFYSAKMKAAVKAAPREISNGWLAYSFGVAPLLSDLKTMGRAMITLKSDMQRHKYKSQRRFGHAVCGGTITVSGLGTSYYAPYGTSSGSNFLDIKVQGTAKKIATVQGMDTTSYNTDIFRNIDYMLKRFMSAGPGSALWEAIPYSFVLDWFVNSTQIIDRVDSTLTGGSKRVVDGCVSVKTNVTASTIYKPQPVAWGPGYRIDSNAGAEIGSYVASSYLRTPTLPSFWIGKSGRFGKKQASLLASLLHQRVANLKLK